LLILLYKERFFVLKFDLMKETELNCNTCL
jgi:hypothetical protein